MEDGRVDHAASRPDAAEFERLTGPYRHEIRLHCYRMLGSLHDAEDAVQETYLRAWRGMSDFAGRASVRTWLYRIATNACLNARRARGRRVLPESLGPAVDHTPLGAADRDIAWLEPYPDAAPEDIRDGAPGPEVVYERREAVRLAFVAALQELPPRQRATLLLRDVLGWSARESAELLGTSVPSINSLLQRARGTLARRPADVEQAPTAARSRELLERYVRTWEAADIDGFVDLLREDAVWSMPPWRQWYVGHGSIRAFLRWAWRPEHGRSQRLVPTAANAQPAFAFYRTEGAGDWQAFAIQVVTLRADGIAAVTNFVDSGLFAAFGLPATLPAAPSDR